MAREIGIEVNPYLERTQLEIHGHFYDKESRLFRMIEGFPMSAWLRQRRNGYQRWEGFLPEAVRELDDDDLSFLFIGMTEDYILFQEELHHQEALLDRSGLSNVHYAIRHVERFAPEDIMNELRLIRERAIQRNILVPPAQALVLRMNAADKHLFQNQTAQVEPLRELRMTYLGICKECKTLCEEQKRNSWEQHRIEIETLFGG